MTVKEWRESKGLTQEAVAKKIKRTKGYVSLLERGERTPSFAVLKAYEKISNGCITVSSFH
jgi:transcriptional regulator with XRE-family HTH domain